MTNAKKTSLGHVPKKAKWEFDESVAQVFDDMLERSIPQYDVLRSTVFDLGCEFVKPKTDILDLGASLGRAIEPFIVKFGANNRYVLNEISPSMLAELEKRYAGFINTKIVEINTCDLRVEFPRTYPSLILSILTIQFTPIDYRLDILSQAYKRLLDGGALILVEKVFGASAEINKAMRELYRNRKIGNGYSLDEIDRKALSLEGVLVPLSAPLNEALLKDSGFRYIDCFWRWLNFAGWIAIK